jgi:hypothetical protein
MSLKQQGIGLVLGLAIGAGGVAFLGSPHPAALAKDAKDKKEKTDTNADYARDARENLKKAHEDVVHMINSASDKKEKGYADAEEAKKAIDRAWDALGRYIGMADEPIEKK